MGAQLPSSLNWISSQSTQLFSISMNNLAKRRHRMSWPAGPPGPPCPHAAPGSPVDDQQLIGGLLIADGADPGGLLLVHLDVERGIEALQVGAGDGPAWDHQPHFPQLRKRETEPSRNACMPAAQAERWPLAAADINLAQRRIRHH